MDTAFLKNPLPPPNKTGQWPNARARKGEFYGVNDPVFQQDQLCVMLMSTWTEVGTIIEHQKRTMKAQNDGVKKLQAANDALAAQLNDLKERYDNLRDAYRTMKSEQLKKANPDLGAAIAGESSVPKSYL